ncbi:MAG: hypothetical protein KC419_12370 [Anaerolineales bacterium]|nr:hypothetical protein [Anaerolineales bacterium]
MSKRPFVIILVLSLLLSAIINHLGFNKPVYSLSANFTIPTKTPEPPPTQKPTSGSQNPPPPAATETPITATATNTAVPVTLAATPQGGFVPTAAACGTQPTIQTVNNTRVRQGPGTDYDIAAELVFLEVRPIVGRAADAEWWQIMLADGSLGWVADAVVTVQGNISVVPIVATPLLDGIAPTAGPAWNPTVPSGCEALAVWTSTPEPTAVPPTDTPEPLTAAATEEPAATDTAVPSTDTPIPLTDTPIPEPTVEPTPIATAVPLDVEPEAAGSSTGIILPIVAAVLFVAGGVIAFLRRNRS